MPKICKLICWQAFYQLVYSGPRYITKKFFNVKHFPKFLNKFNFTNAYYLKVVLKRQLFSKLFINALCKYFCRSPASITALSQQRRVSCGAPPPTTKRTRHPPRVPPVRDPILPWARKNRPRTTPTVDIANRWNSQIRTVHRITTAARCSNRGVSTSSKHHRTNTRTPRRWSNRPSW